jgi:NAD dependent epimerase/dehydratase family enzyme
MLDYSKKNINQIVILGSSGYLGLSFIKYYFNQFESNKNISLILFSSNYSKILKFFKLNNINYKNLNLGFYKYSEFKKLVKHFRNYVILNFSGYNIFKALFSLYNYDYKNKLIWDSRINFTNRIIENIIEVNNYPVFFLLPSAVWIYSGSKISDYFSKWEKLLNLLKNNSYKIVFRLGVVIDENSSWLKILNYFFKFNLKPVFNNNLSFPYIYMNDVLKVIINLINFKYKLSQEELNIFDLFIYTKFNDFINFILKEKYLYKKFKSFYVSDYLMELFFRDYYKAMFLKYRNDFSNLKEYLKN